MKMIQGIDPVDEEVSKILGETSKPMVMGGAYDAANRYSRELATWQPRVRSADGDIIPERQLANVRALDMARNDAFVQAGTELHKDNIVGSMYMLSAKPVRSVLKLDEVWETEFQQEVEAKFTLWAESLNNWPDASRRNNLTSMVRLAVGVYLTGGEVLATAEWMRDNDRPYQTAIQMIELSRLSDPGDQAFDMERTRGGVHFDSYGAPIGYYIRRALPGAFNQANDSHKWSYVRVRNSIGRTQVIHIVEQQRPGQSRGISQLVAALKEMKMTQKFRDVTLQNAVVNASFAATIESELPTQAIYESLGAGKTGADGAISYATSYLGAVSAFAENARNMTMDGAKIPHLMPGSKLNLKPMGTPGGVGTEFEASLLRYVAANLGVSYEQLSKDYSETNYSSARAGMLETWKAMQSRKTMVADRFASMIYRLWFEEALAAGDITSMPRNAPNFYEGLNADAYTSCQWVGAARGQIDELKETQAAILRIKMNLTTYEDELARQGKDWRQTFDQIKREKEMMKDKDIVPLEAQNTNAINAASGKPRQSKGEPKKPQGQEKANV